MKFHLNLTIDYAIQVGPGFISCMENDDESTEHIMELWLSIRGRSITKQWMEEYKAEAAKSTKE